MFDEHRALESTVLSTTEKPLVSRDNLFKRPLVIMS